MGAFDDSLGAAFVGGWIAAIFYGITCVQAFICFRHERESGKGRITYAVATLWLSDTLHSIFVAKTNYWYMVTHFAEPEILGMMPWSLQASIVIDQISVTIVRCFFVYRVWILSGRNRLVTGILAIMVAIVPIAGLTGAGYGFTYKTYSEFDRISWIMLLSYAGAVVADACIAVSLVYFLLKFRSRPTGFSSGLFKRTDSLVNGLVVYFINTGIVTCLSATLCLTLNRSRPGFTFLAFHFWMSPVFVNALLLSWNNRPSMKAQTANTSSMSFPSTLASKRATAGTTMAIPKDAFDMDKRTSTSADSDTLHSSSLGYGAPKLGSPGMPTFAAFPASPV